MKACKEQTLNRENLLEASNCPQKSQGTIHSVAELLIASCISNPARDFHQFGLKPKVPLILTPKSRDYGYMAQYPEEQKFYVVIE
jgi:hypothetical protein